MKTSANQKSSLLTGALLLGLTALSTSSLGAAGTRNPEGKLYVAALGSAAELKSNNLITDLVKKSVHAVNGAILETKKSAAQPGNPAAGRTDFSAMVFSNGTGMYVDPESLLNVKKFEQMPFNPNRTDMDLEPSVSHMLTMLDRGTIGLCNPRMSAGSTMQFQTPFGTINIRARRVVIESNVEYTWIAVLEGESTFRGGDGSNLDLGGQVVKAGQQAFIRRGQPGQPPSVRIEAIPQNAFAALDDKVNLACIAKRSVYFEAVEGSGPEGVTESLVAGAGDGAAGTGGGVSAFDDAPGQQIVAVEVVPAKLPVEFTVSPARVVK